MPPSHYRQDVAGAPAYMRGLWRPSEVNDQLDLLAMARDTDPDTSHAAAADALPRLTKQAASVLEQVRRLEDRFDGVTAWEIYCNWPRAVPVQQNVISRRLTDLHQCGLIVDTDRRRQGGYGSRLIVWRTKETGDESDVL